MAMVAQKAGIIFSPIPKVASTTIRHIMYDLIYGKPFSPSPECKSIFVVPEFHQKVNWKDVDDYYKFTIIRDPFERLLSAYSFVMPDRFIRAHKNQTLPPEYADINLNPDFDEFIEKIEDYKKASRNLAHHVRPYRTCIGRDLSRYNDVLPIEEMHRLPDLLYKAKGVKVEVKAKNQNSQKKPAHSRFSKRTLDLALEFCADDYELCKDFYQPKL